MLEISIIIISAFVIFIVYFARYKNNGTHTFLFSSNFLMKADDTIFHMVKFVFKIYTLLMNNFMTFIHTIPHTVVHFIHTVSHKLAGYTHTLVEKFKKIDEK